MKSTKIPMRMCLGCREMRPKKELVRVVRSPEGEIALDTTGRMHGRGAYLCPNAECAARVLKQKQLERAFGCPIPESFKESLKEAFPQA